MFKYIDFIAPRITLFHNSLLNHSSNFSIVLSIFSIIIILTFSIIFCFDFIYYRNPTSFYYKRFIKDVGEFPLNSSSLFHFVSLLADNNGYLFDDTLISVIGVQILEKDIYEFKFNKTLYNHWLYGLCDENDINDKIKYVNDELLSIYKISYCIKYYFDKDQLKLFGIKDEGFKYPSIKHGQSNEKSVYYGILVENCQNNSYYNIEKKCKDKKFLPEFKSKLIGYGINILDKNIDINSYKEPFKFFFNKISNQLNELTYTSNNLNFNTVLIRTIKGKIFDILNEQKTYIYQYNEKQVNLLDDINKDVYGSFYFWFQNMQEVYQRKYKKIQDVSASIGGIINILIILNKILYKFFEKYVLINDMINNLKIKCSDIVRNVYKTNFDELKINKMYEHNNIFKNAYKTDINELKTKKNNENNIKMNNYFGCSSKDKINEFETISLKKINHLNSNNKNEKNKFNSSFSKIVRLSSLKYNKFQKASYFEILISNFVCFKKKNNFIDRLENFRKNIISEEGMFTTYYILLTLINKNNNDIK